MSNLDNKTVQGNTPFAFAGVPPTNEELLASALRYAELGIEILPCKPDKTPATAHGVCDATSDLDIVRKWWGRGGSYEGHNIAIKATHAWILDADTPKNGTSDDDGLATIAAWVQEHSPLPMTVEAISGRGGRHVYFQPHPGVKSRSRKFGGNYLPGIDTRHGNSYVIAPPSWHYEAGRRYLWCEGRAPGEVPVADAPEWLLERVAPPEPQPSPDQPVEIPANAEPYARAALRNACDRISQAHPGSQEGALNNESLSIGRLVAAGLLGRFEAESALIAAGCTMSNERGRRPWTRDEITRKVRKAITDGSAKGPRAIPVGHNNGSTQEDTEMDNSDTNTPKNTQDKESPAMRLIAIGIANELWRDEEGTAYATVSVDGHRENYPLASQAFTRWLIGQYAERYQQMIDKKWVPGCVGRDTLHSALATLDAIARKTEYKTAIRVAGHQGRVYIDIGDRDWRVIEVDAEGWRVVDTCEVRFIRPKGLLPLAFPEKGGRIDDLRRFINTGSDEDFRQVVSFIVGVFCPHGPYAILNTAGAAGSAKSTLARVIKKLTDAGIVDVRMRPKDPDDLVRAAKNSWLTAYDNLSYLDENMADCLCQIATGAGISKRTLYTNMDETLAWVRRPQMINGINELALRGDLADRCVTISLAPIKERKTEKVFWAEFDEAAPRILGAILDGVSCALRRQDSVSTETPPRMADHALWAEAAGEAFGWEPGQILRETLAAQNASVETVLEADAVAKAIRDLMGDRTKTWKGTASELYNELLLLVDDDVRRDKKRWPVDPTRLSGRMTRILPQMGTIGFQIERTLERDPRTGSMARQITINRDYAPHYASVNATGNSVIKETQEYQHHSTPGAADDAVYAHLTHRDGGGGVDAHGSLSSSPPFSLEERAYTAYTAPEGSVSSLESLENLASAGDASERKQERKQEPSERKQEPSDGQHPFVSTKGTAPTWVVGAKYTIDDGRDVARGVFRGLDGVYPVLDLTTGLGDVPAGTRIKAMPAWLRAV